LVRRHLARAALAALLAFCLATADRAQSNTPGGMPPPPGMSLANSAAMRFPQPVRVGDLPGRDVLQPVESQNVLGRVQDVVRLHDGTVAIVMTIGGVFGFGARPIAVPVDAMVLLGPDMEMVALTPRQLLGFLTFLPAGSESIPADATIKVGLAKPSH
jgi:hypothetical protein